MRSLRKTAGVGLILLGLSGLALTAMVVQDPVGNMTGSAEDPLDPPAPSSMDTLAMGLTFAGLGAVGTWLVRTSRR